MCYKPFQGVWFERMDPLDKSFTTSTLTQVAGCTADTLRTWRNRNGLFPATANTAGWKRFSLVDICTVRAVVLMTEHGVTANHAVWFANSQLQMDFEALLLGVPFSRFVAIIRNPKPSPDKTLVMRSDGTGEIIDGKDLPPQEVLFKRLAEDASISSAMELSHGIATIIDLDEIVSQVRSRFNEGAA